jgi:microcystin-dependent protein
MTDGIMSEVRMFAGNFAPKAWAICDGSLLSISTNAALFSLLGKTFGGDGISNFALPDLRGRTPIGPTSTLLQGQIMGNESTTLSPANLVPHNHNVSGAIQMLTTALPAGALTPGGNYFANDGSTLRFDTTNDGVTMEAPMVNLTIGPAGSGAPVPNMMPYVVINYIICIAGIFPSRN